MRSLFPLALASLTALAATPASAQQTDEQLWLASTGSAPLGDGMRVTVEAIARFSDRAAGFFHDEIGGSLSRTVAPGVELAIGYRHVDDYDHGRAKPNEERLRQFVTAQLGHGFTARLRFEERFQRGGSEVAFRMRPQLRFTLPLDRHGLQLFATQEHFLNFNGTRWGVRSGYERMRNAVGLSIPLSPKLRGDLGYLNQYRFGRAGARDQMDHAATFSIALTL
ncbi:DUF2490 domain-containing protein [Sphingomonas sp.]|uniref:DUF2490 domain-containing protein n=1 Tax=Sphingomonas sp. TaxID=28214 RepID=UPI001B03CB8A|nr:DUF2490 domain-containing protein [Sphingomonas sp.]MBO9713206.1 DUF2490 domain-containing protein [Sphingomonas sp.]